MQKINDGLSREPIRGIIDLESCLQDMKRRWKTTWIGATIMQYHYL